MLRIKRAVSDELRNEVFALRYRAYLNEDAITQSENQRFEDGYDLQPNHILWALTEHEQVVGSIRTTWFDPNTNHLLIPEMEGYSEDVIRIVPSDARILSGNRFVTEPNRKDRNGLWAMLLLRHHMLVAHKHADYALAAVRVNHLPFYRRVLKLDRVSDGRIYPGLTSTMYLTACEFGKHIDDVYVNTPLLKPRGYERMLMDETYRDIWELGLPIEY